MGVRLQDNLVHLVIAIWPWGADFSEEGMKRGIRARIASFGQHHASVMMTKAKICGNHVNSTLAKIEATRDRYDEAIHLDPESYVSKETGENIFIVRNGQLKTLPLTSILPGITRDSMMRIAKDQALEVIEERFTWDEIYIAQETFFTGTAAEVTPICEVDNRPIGKETADPITLKLQETYFKAVRGELDKYLEWLRYV